MQAKKKSRGGHFEGTSTNGKAGNAEKAAATTPPLPEVTWEYKGNEDSAIHGLYTSQEIYKWTSCGYLVGKARWTSAA